MNTCDKCKHWTAEDLQFSLKPILAAQYKDQGECDLFGDINDFQEDAVKNIRNDVCYGSDYESYHASVVVMAKFGCIHWEAK